jgi:cold shock CspA family protein
MSEEGGVVVTWLPDKGFGFLRADNPNHLRDVYFHETRIASGRDRLKRGARVTFEVVSKPDGRLAAHAVKVQEDRGEKLWAS